MGNVAGRFQISYLYLKIISDLNASFYCIAGAKFTYVLLNFVMEEIFLMKLPYMFIIEKMLYIYLGTEVPGADPGFTKGGA